MIVDILYFLYFNDNFWCWKSLIMADQAECRPDNLKEWFTIATSHFLPAVFLYTSLGIRNINFLQGFLTFWLPFTITNGSMQAGTKPVPITYTISFAFLLVAICFLLGYISDKKLRQVYFKSQLSRGVPVVAKTKTAKIRIKRHGVELNSLTAAQKEKIVIETKKKIEKELLGKFPEVLRVTSMQLKSGSVEMEITVEHSNVDAINLHILEAFAQRFVEQQSPDWDGTDFFAEGLVDLSVEVLDGNSNTSIYKCGSFRNGRLISADLAEYWRLFSKVTDIIWTPTSFSDAEFIAYAVDQFDQIRACFCLITVILRLGILSRLGFFQDSVLVRIVLTIGMIIAPTVGLLIYVTGLSKMIQKSVISPITYEHLFHSLIRLPTHLLATVVYHYGQRGYLCFRMFTFQSYCEIRTRGDWLCFTLAMFMIKNLHIACEWRFRAPYFFLLNVSTDFAVISLKPPGIATSLVVGLIAFQYIATFGAVKLIEFRTRSNFLEWKQAETERARARQNTKTGTTSDPLDQPTKPSADEHSLEYTRSNSEPIDLYRSDSENMELSGSKKDN